MKALPPRRQGQRRKGRTLCASEFPRLTPAQEAEAFDAIQAEAKRQAKEMFRHQAVRQGFGGEVALEDAFMEMAIFAIGHATGQTKLSTKILKEAA